MIRNTHARAMMKVRMKPKSAIRASLWTLTCSTGWPVVVSPGWLMGGSRGASDVDRLADRRGGGLHHRLAQGRVGVDRLVDLLGRGLKLHREPVLRYELRRLRADDVRAVDLPRLGVGDHLHESLG